MARVFDSVVLSTVSPSTAVTSPQLTHQIMARLPLLTTVCLRVTMETTTCVTGEAGEQGPLHFQDVPARRFGDPRAA